MLLIRIKCPQCNYLCESYNRAGTREPKYYGSPFRTCPSCGKGYVRTGFYELACKPLSYYEKRLTIRRWAKLIALMSFVCACVVPVLAVKKDLAEVAIYAMIGCSTMGFISSFVAKAHGDDLNRKILTKEYPESKRRMSDPMYAEAIRRIGMQ